MSKRQKNTLMLSYFAKQTRKKSIEIKEHDQEIYFPRPICSISASLSTEFDSAEERIKLGFVSICAAMKRGQTEISDSPQNAGV